MPNSVSYSDEKTLLKACGAIMRSVRGCTFEGAQDVINEMLNAGLLIRERAVKEESDSSSFDNLKIANASEVFSS